MFIAWKKTNATGEEDGTVESVPLPDNAEPHAARAGFNTAEEHNHVSEHQHVPIRKS